MFVLNYWLSEFLLSAFANRFELRCEPKRLMLLYYKIYPYYIHADLLFEISNRAFRVLPEVGKVLEAMKQLRRKVVRLEERKWEEREKVGIKGRKRNETMKEDKKK